MHQDLEKKIALRQETLDRVRNMIISALRFNLAIEDLDPDTPLFGTGLGLDSVDAVALIVECESEFNIRISEEEGLYALRSVNTLVDIVLEKQLDTSDE